MPFVETSSFHPLSWWSSAFRMIAGLGVTFSSFVKSFHRKPATSLNSENTATIWPMALPYPSSFAKRNVTEESISLQFRKGVNLAVACLNWLHLRRPAVCPAEIVLGSKLS